MAANDPRVPAARPDGAVFISYHQKSGAQTAEFVETYLRSGGIVPWRDVRDLEAGAVQRSIREAFADGLSGAVLLISDGIEESDFVPQEELPLILDVTEKDTGDFRFLHIVNTIRKPGTDQPDINAPADRLKAKCPRANTLSAHLQRALLHKTGPEEKAVNELGSMLRDLLRARLRNWPRDKTLEVGLQTRPTPSHLAVSSRTPDDSHLHIRLRQDATTQIPEELDLHCLKQTLPQLIDEIHGHGVQRIRFRGGCHPSLAWTLGTALPKSRDGIETFTWHDVAGNDWCSTDKPTDQKTTIQCLVLAPEREASDPVPVAADGKALRDALSLGEGRRNVVVLLTTENHLREPLTALARSIGPAPVLLIQFVTQPDAHGNKMIHHSEGAELARRTGEILRHLGDGANIHLAVQIPVALAALTARQCNTLTMDFYELGDFSLGAKSYIRVLRMAAGNRFPITEVYARATPQIDRIRTLRNLTPHAVTIFPEAGTPFSWAPDSPDAWIDRQTTPEELPTLRVCGQEIPVTRVRHGRIQPSPPMIPEVGYIVPRALAEAARRPDFFFPHGELRSESGAIIGYRGLGCFESVTDRTRPFLDWIDPL